MKKYLIHILKVTKSLFIRPIRTIRWIKEDIYKDSKSKDYKSKYKFVWCAGLPKSGTSLIEEIFDYLPYVRQSASFNRIFYPGRLDHVHGISEELFENFPKDKFTFLKTHTHYSEKYEKISNKYNLRVIISLRDIRDMLISRYFHIKNFKKHYLHDKINSLNFTDGFIESLKSKSSPDLPNALNYYYFWIFNWIKVSKKRKYLVLWYENYKENPEEYIDKILNYVDFKNFSPKDIEKKLELKRKNNQSINESLSEYGKLKGTFRKGKVDEWKDHFNEEISEYFFSNIPGNLNEIIYKGEEIKKL